MGKKSRDKGARVERRIVNILQKHGFDAKRTAPLQTFKSNGAADILADDLKIEVKARASGFKQIYAWLAEDDNDALVIVADRQTPLVILPLEEWCLKIKED